MRWLLALALVACTPAVADWTVVGKYLDGQKWCVRYHLAGSTEEICGPMAQGRSAVLGVGAPRFPMPCYTDSRIGSALPDVCLD